MSRLETSALLVITVLAVAAALVPIWGLAYFPTTDGPSHVENALLLRQFCGADQRVHDLYTLNPDPVPNWFSHLTLAALMSVLPPLAAEKAWLTGYVLLFVAAVIYFLRSVSPRGVIFAPLAFPLLYSYPLQMGFYNWAVSVPIMLWVLGFWWRRRAAPDTARTIVALNALLVLLYFCHIVSMGLTVACGLGFTALTGPGGRRRAVRLGMCLYPACVLPIYYLASRGARVVGDYDLADVGAFLRLDVLISHHPATAWVAGALASLYGALLAATIGLEAVRRWRERRLARGEARDFFLLAAIAVSVLHVFTPQNVAEGGFMRERLAIYPFLLVLPWLSPRLARPLRLAAAGAAMVIMAAHVTLLTTKCAELNRVLAEFTSGTPQVKRDDVILPLCFEQHGMKDTRVPVIVHAASYYALATGAIQLNNYEARLDYFPLRFVDARNPYRIIGPFESHPHLARPEAYPTPIDAILVWDYRGQFTESTPGPGFPSANWVAQHFRVVHRQGRLLILRRGASISTDARNP